MTVGEKDDDDDGDDDSDDDSDDDDDDDGEEIDMEAKIEKELNKKQLLRLEKMFLEADADGGGSESYLATSCHRNNYVCYGAVAMEQLLQQRNIMATMFAMPCFWGV